MGTLLFFFFLALIISFFSSLFESMLLTIPPAYLETIDRRKGYGKIIRKLKINVEKPLAAILTINTIANTIGAAGVGAQAVKLWGDAYLGIVSAFLTIMILVFSEIIPKSLGAYYWKSLVPFASYAIKLYIYITYPFVYLSEFITKYLLKGKENAAISKDEIIAMTEIANSQKTLSNQECSMIKNVLKFSDVSAEKVMTPRSVLFAAPQNITILEFLNYNNVNSFTRIPVYDKTLDMITGYVHKNDILKKLKDDLRNDTLDSCKRKIITFGEKDSLSKLFEKLVVEKEQISLIIDDFGGTAGIVTMEDIIETLLGIEILDEHDVDSDMQLLARNRYLRYRKI